VFYLGAQGFIKRVVRSSFFSLPFLGTKVQYEPEYHIDKPLLLIVGDKDKTGNIRKVMPLWANHESDCKFVVIPNAKHAANLDDPDYFHKTIMDFLTRFMNNQVKAG
jgi:pimeloyl-ACP methyl ester carboxylesterase